MTLENIRVLIVDDDKNIRRSLQVGLQNLGCEVIVAIDPMAALREIRERTFDILVCDIVMGEMSGVDLFSKIQQMSLSIPAIFMSGSSSLSEVAKIMQMGAIDFIEKPFTVDTLVLAIQRALEMGALREKLDRLANSGADEMIGASSPLGQVRELVSRVARTNASVLISGESGTGKELVARQIHAQSPRSVESFISVNCSAVPENLVESELFGHEKGAFTGALKARRGLFELANRGTLFLDEIGDMSLSTQAKVLRAIQNGEIQPVGLEKTRKVDVRLVCASHHDLAERVKEGKFREDLFFRLNVVPVHLPALRDRASDIPVLVGFFARSLAQTLGYAERPFSSEALQILSEYRWPGNIRELRNVIERLLIIGQGTVLPEHLSQILIGSRSEQPHTSELKVEFAKFSLKEFRDQSDRALIVSRLRLHDGNVTQAAASLDVERTYLHRLISQFQIEKREYF